MIWAKLDWITVGNIDFCQPARSVLGWGLVMQRQGVDSVGVVECHCTGCMQVWSIGLRSPSTVPTVARPVLPAGCVTSPWMTRSCMWCVGGTLRD